MPIILPFVSAQTLNELRNKTKYLSYGDLIELLLKNIYVGVSAPQNWGAELGLPHGNTGTK